MLTLLMCSARCAHTKGDGSMGIAPSDITLKIGFHLEYLLVALVKSPSRFMLFRENVPQLAF